MYNQYVHVYNKHERTTACCTHMYMYVHVYIQYVHVLQVHVTVDVNLFTMPHCIHSQRLHSNIDLEG